jgi:hypothetical protein
MTEIQGSIINIFPKIRVYVIIKASFSKKICGQPSTLNAMNPCFRNTRTCVTPFWQIDLIVVVVLKNGVHVLLIIFNCF